MAAVAILKKIIIVESFGTKFFYVFGVREHDSGIIFWIWVQIFSQLPDKRLFYIKIGIFVKITVKRIQFNTVYQNFYYNMFVYGHIFLKKYRMLRLNNAELKYDSSE